MSSPDNRCDGHEANVERVGELPQHKFALGNPVHSRREVWDGGGGEVAGDTKRWSVKKWSVKKWSVKKLSVKKWSVQDMECARDGM